MLKKIIKLFIFLSLSLSLPSPCFAKKIKDCSLKTDGKVLYVYNWSNYLPERVIEKFKTETGITIIYDTFESLELLETKLMAGEKYDIVFPSLYPTLIRSIYSRFMPLQKKWIPNLKNLDDPIIKKIPKIALSYGIPYAWGTTGIGYDKEKIRHIMPEAPLDSWSILFEPKWLKKLKDQGISLMDNSIEMLQPILIYLGLDPLSTDKEVWDKALQHFEKIRPYIRQFDSGHQIENLTNGQNILIQGYSTYVNIAQEKTRHTKKAIRYIIPKEGAISWVDMIAIPKNAQHPINAHLFINFILRPEIIAEISSKVHAANAVQQSKAFIDQKTLNNPSIFPPEKTYARLYPEGFYPAHLTRYITRLWMQIKSGYTIQWTKDR